MKKNHLFPKVIQLELNQPHDLLSRRILCDVEVFAELLANYGDSEIIKLIDLNSLQCESPITVSEELREVIEDLRFSAEFKEKGHSRIFFMLEHQSKKVILFIIRCLRNILMFFEQCLSAPNRTITQEGKLPYPIIVLLYHGKVTWSDVLQIKNLISVPKGLDISGFLSIHFFVIDLSGINRDELRGSAVLVALLDSLISYTYGDLSDRIERIFGYFEPVKNDKRIHGWINSYVSYFLAVMGDSQKEAVARAASKILHEREVNMIVDSVLGQTYIKGIKEGKIEGKIADVLKILKSRFKKVPVSVTRAVESYTDLIALESLIDRALDCETLEEFKENLAH
ncbi:MAG: Rpn family recombination-promoting nuclease/putative transposase [Planctomycetaceae bacterium]|jgi:hypothetical protein|nr:Rpn family recombination-promoting nuclease/putative transposase [Planctomycetaceae bacterium]